MLHLPALPGSPGHSLRMQEIRDWVLRDAETLAAGGVDGFILENFGDAPFYPDAVPPHTVAFMAVLGRDVKTRFDQPLGVNVLRNDAQSALAVATAAGAQFMRVNVYTGARLTDQGIIQGKAHELLRYRKLLGADIAVAADVAVKHSVSLGPHELLDEVEETILRGRADAIIISGTATGKETRLEDLKVAKDAAGDTPVFCGSGANLSNLADIFKSSDALIVGTALKRNGVSTNPVDLSRVKKFMADAVVARDSAL